MLQTTPPIAIDRRETFLVKWSIAAVAAPLLTGDRVLLVAVGILGMYAPDVLLLWALLTLAALMIATGTLALLAIFGSIGQLLAMILLIYLSIASARGTVPIQALPGILQTVGHVEPLRNTLMGTRAILYFGARGDAGLTTSLDCRRGGEMPVGPSPVGMRGSRGSKRLGGVIGAEGNG